MMRKYTKPHFLFVGLVLVYAAYFLIFRGFGVATTGFRIHEKEKPLDQVAKMDHSAHHQHVHNHGVDARHDMNHGGDEDVMCDSMHAMVFHIGVCQQILFPGWTSTTAGELVGACVAVFVAAALYEGLKCWREVLFRKGTQGNLAPSQMNITKQECGPDSNCSGQKIVKYPMLSLMHCVQTLLHMLQVFLSYLLMLIFMTYNVWLCLALLLGTGLGYFLFGWRKQSVVDLTEHCQ